MTDLDEISLKIIDPKSIYHFSENSFPEPIDHILARAGVCSLRAAGTFLKNNDVRVGVVSTVPNAASRVEKKPAPNSMLREEIQTRITTRNFRVDAEHTPIFVNNKQLPLTEHLYIIIDKPLGVVCSRVSDRHKTIFDILPNEIKSHKMYEHLHCVGRLDADTSGLVILTTNGVFSNYMMSPKNHISKTYEVTLRDEVPKYAKTLAGGRITVEGECAIGVLTQADYIERFKNGIELPPEKKSAGFTTAPAELVWRVGCSVENQCTITIHEGKFHQVRRMFAALGNEVVVLRRISIGGFRTQH